MSKKKILCVGASDAAPGLCEALQAADWTVHGATDLRSAGRLVTDFVFDAGLLVFPEPDDAFCAELDDFLCTASRLEWIGCFTPAALGCVRCREVIVTHLFDHHTLPLDLPRLMVCLGHAKGRTELRRQARRAEAPASDDPIIGQSPAMAELLRQAHRAAAAAAPVLIHGESGSGKELIAQCVHRRSPRAKGPFVPINCGAIQPSLIQSELFGHEKGAFTGATGEKRGLFEAANGGTVFLDEIGDLPLGLQANLLRFLQEGTITRVGASRSIQLDVRVVAATHLDLQKAVAAGTFRQDLFYRLDVLPLRVMPLRERRQDIKPLARHFFEQYAAEKSPALKGFSRRAFEAMEAHAWPGNVRELINRVRTAMIMAEGKLIMPADLGLEMPSGMKVENALDDARFKAERRAIFSSLQQTGRNIAGSARQLGVSRMTLYRLMAKHGIDFSH
jgi:DNA-binding NtrC family response regulator